MAVKKNLLNIGDRVDLYLGTGPVYRTMLEDIADNGNLLVSVPTYKGVPIKLSKGQGLQIYFYRPTGRYRVNVKMITYQQHEQLRMLELKPLSEPQKQQRRESFRIQADLKVLLRYADNEIIPEKLMSPDLSEQEVASSVNISATGIAIRTKKVYNIGDKLFLRIFLKWPDESAAPLEVIGEIRQIDLLDPVQKINYVGVMFLYTSNDIYEHISKYVMAQEQKRLKQKRLVEGD